MGTGQSQEQEDRSGWRILKVMPNSPCDQLGLVPYFDVLTDVNGTRLSSNQSSLLSLIAEGTPTKLTVLNYPQKKSREVTVIPSRNWGGNGLLGLIIRYDCYENADEDVMHVLDVIPNSPAHVAGLQPGSDYLLGTAEVAFKAYENLDYFLAKFNGKSTSIFVFNSQTYRVREVSITPNSNWGGKGSLGCDLGLGLLHRLPLQSKSQVPVSLEQSGISSTLETAPSTLSSSSSSSGSSGSSSSIEATSSPGVVSPSPEGISDTYHQSSFPSSDPSSAIPSQFLNPTLDNLMSNATSPFYPGRHAMPASSSRPYAKEDLSYPGHSHSHGGHHGHDHSHGSQEHDHGSIGQHDHGSHDHGHDHDGHDCDGHHH